MTKDKFGRIAGYAMSGVVIAFMLLTISSAAALELKSTDVKDGAPIPQIHFYPRCGGQNLSPALSWSGVPKNARSFRSMKARSSGLSPAPAGCPQSDGMGASVTFRIHLLSWRASPSGK